MQNLLQGISTPSPASLSLQSVEAFEFLQACLSAHGVRKGLTCSQSRCLCQERDAGSGFLGGAKMRALCVLLIVVALANAASAGSDTANQTTIPGAAHTDCARLVISLQAVS